MTPFELKKLVALFTQLIPGALFLILLLLLFCNRHRQWPRYLIAFVTLSLLALSSPAVNRHLAASLESPHAEVVAPPQGTEFIAVLSGGPHRPSARTPSVVLSPGQIARLTEAVRLWRLTPEASFVTTGGHLGSQPGGQLSGADAMAEVAMWFGVPDEKIIRFSTVNDTEQELKMLSEVVGSRSTVIVSSAFHLSRIALLAEKLSIPATYAPSDWLSNAMPWWRFSTSALNISEKVIHEYIGMLWYRLKNLL